MYYVKKKVSEGVVMEKYEEPCLEIEMIEEVLTLVEISGGGNDVEIQSILEANE